MYNDIPAEKQIEIYMYMYISHVERFELTVTSNLKSERFD